jgi:hypothetical protein
MNRIRWLLVVVGLSVGTTDLRAQILLPRGYGRLSYGGIGFGIARPRARLAFSLGGAYGGGFGYLGGFGYSPFGYVGNRVTIIYTQPAIVLAPPPPLLLDDLEPEPRPRPREDAPPPVKMPPAEKLPPPPPAERPLPKGDPIGGFRPQDPNNCVREPLPMPPEQPKAPEPAPKPPRPRRDNKLLELPRPPGPEANPRDEYARLIELGREAFAGGEYGRASQRFQQAATFEPREAWAHFLLAQAQLALGKYGDAVDAIRAGMARQPDWPTVRFQPLELYGDNVADYAEHLHRLEEVLRQRPDDAILLFLYAYELWFDGRQDEARPLFQRAQPKAADPGNIESFLRALPEAPVL